MKKQLLVSGVIALLSTIGVTAATTTATDDLPTLSARVDTIQAQVTNNTADIQALQTSTGTAPAEHVAVPEPVAAPVTAPAAPIVQTPPVATPAPTAAPTQVTATCNLIKNEDGVLVPDCQ